MSDDRLFRRGGPSGGEPMTVEQIHREIYDRRPGRLALMRSPGGEIQHVNTNTGIHDHLVAHGAVEVRECSPEWFELRDAGLIPGLPNPKD
jgi:hypothetical protein